MACEGTYLGDCCEERCANGQTPLELGKGGVKEFTIAVDDEFKLNSRHFGCYGTIGLTPPGMGPIMAVGWWAYQLSIFGSVRMQTSVFAGEVIDQRTVVALPPQQGFPECFSARGFDGFLQNAFVQATVPANFSRGGVFFIDPCQNPALIWLILSFSQRLSNTEPCAVTLEAHWIEAPP